MTRGVTIAGMGAVTLGLLCLWLSYDRSATGGAVVPRDPRPALPEYETFNKFCVANFGAEKEPLVRQRFGDGLVIYEEGLWVHASESSAVVGFQTNLPAKTWVEYGEGFGQRTAEPERCYSLHLHYLKALRPSQAVRYRLVAVDERGMKVVSEPMVFTPAAMTAAVRIPGGAQGPPYVLDRAGATYLLTQDITAEGTALDVQAENVTLDLGGHRVVYNSKAWGPIGGDNLASLQKGHSGIHGRRGRASGLKVLNGLIVQGAGADGERTGAYPIFTQSIGRVEIAGVTVVYSGPQLCGMLNHWAGQGFDIHHNVVQDLGKAITNRHGLGCRAIAFYGSPSFPETRLRYNLVKRTRHSGLGSAHLIHHNEVYIDSYDTNAFGISLSQEGKAYENRVFGGGYHVCAFGWGTKLTCYRNFIHLKAEALPDRRSTEFGAVASCNGFRLTQYSPGARTFEDNDCYENVIVIHAKDGRQVRGVQVTADSHVKNYVWRDGVMKIIAEDDRTTRGSCIVAQGHVPERCLPVLYKNNILITNLRHVCIGDDYGPGGGNHQIIGCKFVKVGNHPGYRAVTFEERANPPSGNHIIRDPIFEGGASLDAVNMGGGNHDFSLQWTLYIKARPGTKVTAKDRAGAAAFTGEVGAEGLLEVPLTQFKQTPAGKTPLTPHEVTVGTSVKTLRMERPMGFEVLGDQWKEFAPPAPQFVQFGDRKVKALRTVGGGAN